ncbi:MAG TPA: universal stress protein [Candidatus Limnocylindrales bacterium]|nr:universal stress protein [Candidatus Limnocylindrales bacterium]
MRLLVAVDGSPDAQKAVALVAATSWPADTSIRLVAVAETIPAWLALPTEGIPPIDPEAIDRAAAKELAAALEASAVPLRDAGLTVETVLRTGRPATVIAQEASDAKVDLVVVGSRGQGPFRSMLLGSVSAEVVDAATVPVLVARSASLAPVIVADDGSPCARRAVDLLLAWPALAAGGVRVVSVAAVPQMSLFSLEPLPPEAGDLWLQTRDALLATARRVAGETADRLQVAGLKVEVATPEGDPAHAVVDEATQHEAGLVIMGSRGQTGLTRLVLGSVARNVLHHAPCSVLVVKGPVPKD